MYEKGECEIRAVAGQEKVDPKDPKLQDLIARAAWAAGRGEQLYLCDRTDPASDAERMFLNIFGADLEADGVESGLYLPLKDEAGVLGVLVFEAGKPEFATPVQLEVAAILANQTAVALRNAQLYHQVPMVDALGALAARKRAVLAHSPTEAAALWWCRTRSDRCVSPHSLAVSGGRQRAGLPADGSGAGAGAGSWSGRTDPGKGRSAGGTRCSVGVTPLHAVWQVIGPPRQRRSQLRNDRRRSPRAGAIRAEERLHRIRG